MASEERYLWFFNFEFHGEARIWWAYFRDRQEAEGWFGWLGDMVPCIRLCSAQECPQGFSVHSDRFYPCSSLQINADAARKGITRVRHRWLFPLAPLACDYRASLVACLKQSSPCLQCAPLFSELQGHLLLTRSIKWPEISV